MCTIIKVIMMLVHVIVHNNLMFSLQLTKSSPSKKSKKHGDTNDDHNNTNDDVNEISWAYCYQLRFNDGSC